MYAFRFVLFFSSRRRHTRFSRDWSSDVYSSDLSLDARRLAHDARAGHPVAVAAFQRGADALAAAIVSAAALFDLDDVVVGGGVAAAGDGLFSPLRAGIRARSGLGFLQRLRIHRSPLGADAGLLGAAALALDAVAT